MIELQPAIQPAAIKPVMTNGRSPSPFNFVRVDCMPRIPLQPMSGSEARDALRTASNRQLVCIAFPGDARSLLRALAVPHILTPPRALGVGLVERPDFAGVGLVSG